MFWHAFLCFSKILHQKHLLGETIRFSSICTIFFVRAGGEAIAAEVLASHAAHKGVRCRGCSWGRWGERGDELAELAGCLGGVALAAICECFAEDYGGWTGGMPDLVVWQRCGGER